MATQFAATVTSESGMKLKMNIVIEDDKISMLEKCVYAPATLPSGRPWNGSKVGDMIEWSGTISKMGKVCMTSSEGNRLDGMIPFDGDDSFDLTYTSPTGVTKKWVFEVVEVA